MPNVIYVFCPHCEGVIMIDKKDLNCHIFRHAVLKTKLDAFINPHETKENCEKLLSEGKIYGCGKPFRVILSDKNHKAVTCDYI